MKPATLPLFEPEPERVRVCGTAQRLAPAVHLAETTPGEARFLWFQLGMPEMDDQDFRQFEVTPENAVKMVALANKAIADGTEIWVNYGHDVFGPRAGDAIRFELGPDGSVYGVVRWNDAARAAVKQDPPVWKYFSPEFWVEQVLDGDGNPKFVGGKAVMRPFEISGGALTNTPAMKKLAVTANVKPSPDQASERKELDMKLSAEVAKLLKLDPEKASQEDFDKAVQELAAKKGTATGPDPETVKAQVRQEMAAQREEIRKEVHEELRKESAAKDRKAKVERLLAQATSEGKVVADNREGLEALAAADPDAFEKVLPGLAVHAPVKSWFTPAREKASAKVPVSALSDPAVSREVAERATALAAEKQIPYTEALNSLVTA